MVEEPKAAQRKAGKIAAKARDDTADKLEPGMKILEVCEYAESRITEMGAKPAFPCNVSIDHIAAHYTSPRNDDSTIPDSGLVKLDIGVHVDGYIADTARTVDMDGELEAFIAATDDALQEAISLMRPGVSLGEVGSKIEEVIRAYGLRPIRNLSGHQMKRFRLHAGKQVPNVKQRFTDKIEVGDIYAIEPFATTGTGKVADTKYTYIFSNTRTEASLDDVTQKLRDHLLKTYGPLPFAARWVGTRDGDLNVEKEFTKLLDSNAIKAYPVLVEKGNRPVSQSEHTVFVGRGRTLTLTLGD